MVENDYIVKVLNKDLGELDLNLPLLLSGSVMQSQGALVAWVE